MAKDHRKVSEHLAQVILLEDPNFLRRIVDRVLQEMLEAEMTHHIGPLPTSVATSAPATATATSRGP